MTSPLTIVSIYEFPVLLSSPTCDVTKPAQDWQRPLAAGENAGDDFVYPYFLSIDGSQHTFVMTKGQANTPNVYTAAAITAANLAGITINSTPYPTPVNLALLPPGAIVAVNPNAIFNQPPIIVLAAPPPAAGATGATGATGAAGAPDADEAAILTVVDEIAAVLNLPQK